MDFNLSEEQQAFRDVVRRWVDAELPKDWMRRLEADEENYPFGIWDKLEGAGLLRHRHPRGIWRPGRRRRHADDLRARNGAHRGRAAVGLGADLVRRRQDDRRRSAAEEQKERWLPADGGGRAARLAVDDRTRRRHRRARRDEDLRRKGRRRLEAERRQDVDHRAPRSPTGCWCSRAPTRTSAKKHQGLTMFFVDAQVAGHHRHAAAQARHARDGISARSLRRRVRARRGRARRARARPGTRCCRRSTTSGSWSARNASARSTACSRMRSPT